MFNLIILSSKNIFERHNGPATARPLQEGRFWKRSETKKRILRVFKSFKFTKKSERSPFLAGFFPLWVWFFFLRLCSGFPLGLRCFCEHTSACPFLATEIGVDAAMNGKFVEFLPFSKLTEIRRFSVISKSRFHFEID